MALSAGRCGSECVEYSPMSISLPMPKTFIFSCTGIRTLFDIYVYNESCYDSMDPEYIFEQCKILGIQDYEKN